MKNQPLIGNVVVGQSGGPTAAINATLAGVLRGARRGVENGVIGKIFGMRNGVEGLLARRLVDLTEEAGNAEWLRLLEQTPAAALGSCRRRLPDPKKDTAVYEELLSIFKENDIRYFFYIGGNDSMDTVHRLSTYVKKSGWEMRVMGVPKTIDNDLFGTDHTPGFGSAAKYIATTMSEILCDTAVYTVPAVTIVEIMGRDAGWLTASAALAGVNGAAPDLVYLPEVSFSMEQFYADVEKALARHPNVVVAVSEGIRFENGAYVGEGMQSGAVDVFGHKYLSGTAKVLEQAVKAKFGCKVRSVELNLPQRCAGHLLSATDITESVRIGRDAVTRAIGGKTASVMAFVRGEGAYRVTTRAIRVSKVANQVRSVPRAWINAEGNGVTEECIDYLLPLIQGEVKCKYESGIPAHLVI